MSINSIRETIYSTLSVLIGKKLNYIGRAAEMLDIGFGDDVEYMDLNGEMRMVARFVMHIQTPWRLAKNSELILGSYDFYVSKPGITTEEFESEMFGNSMFDSIADELNSQVRLKPITIEQIYSNDMGDVTLLFDDDTQFEVFINSSIEMEFWRFFKMDDNSEHFVVFDE